MLPVRGLQTLDYVVMLHEKQRVLTQKVLLEVMIYRKLLRNGYNGVVSMESKKKLERIREMCSELKYRACP